jgi:hypothetical protein
VNVKELRKDCDGFKGRFFYDGERGDLAYIAKDCDDRQCDCEVKTNSDGDQDCSESIADIDEAWEPIARMLNALPEALDEIERLRAGMGDDTATLYAENLLLFRREIDLVTKERDEARALKVPASATEVLRVQMLAATAVAERDESVAETASLRASNERLRTLLVEACDIGAAACACTSERGRNTVRGYDDRLAAIRAAVTGKSK